MDNSSTSKEEADRLETEIFQADRVSSVRVGGERRHAKGLDLALETIEEHRESARRIIVEVSVVDP